jgi:phage-related protein
MANEIKFTLAGDNKSLVRALDGAGDAARDMGDDFVAADKNAGRFSGGVSSLNEKIDASESKFMGAADLVDGLAGAFGISLGPTVEYARAFGDMAGGFTATLGPAMEQISGKLGKLSAVTKIQTMAQTALNAVMRGNPIFLVITAIAALTAGFVIAYKKSETFRAIVHGAMNGVKTAVQGAWDLTKRFFGAISDGVSDMARVMARVADIITTPYQLAFRAVASLWNNTVGRLSVSIPGFMGFGGISFDVPDIPMLASGGTAWAGRAHIIGEKGPELFVPGRTGTVVPNHKLGGPTVIRFDFTGGEAALVELMRKAISNRGGNVQVVLGRT